MPQLELQVAALAVQISKMIQRKIEIEFNQFYYWTESEIMQKYIQNEGKWYTVYMGNRIAEIRENLELLVAILF